MAALRKILIVLAWLALVPASAHAQATLAGVVKDTSGAVLPGVTVEASSPALIEKVRTAMTDSTGQYQIVDLRPGTYTVTFTLTGFAGVKRDDVAVTGAGVSTDQRRHASRQRDGGAQRHGRRRRSSTSRARAGRRCSTTKSSTSFPSRAVTAPSRGHSDAAGAGANSSSSVNPSFFTVHGGPANEGRVMMDGLSVGAAFNGGGVSGNAYDVANRTEMQITLSGALGEAEIGGPMLNIVPMTGGNTFKGTVFVTGAGEWAQGNNVDAALRAQGITEAAGLIKLWDVSFSIGGPIKRDKLWFFANYRDQGNHTDIPGLYANKFAGDPSHWDYAPDPNVKGRTATSKTIASVPSDLATDASQQGRFLLRLSEGLRPGRAESD